MTLLCPDVGEVILLRRILYEAPTDLTLKLYRTDVTPAEGDTAGSYTVANFTDYVDKTLTASQTGGTWTAPATSGGTTSASYAQQSWTCGASGNTIYGYYIVNSGGTLVIAEKFAAARTLVSSDELRVTPRVELA